VLCQETVSYNFVWAVESLNCKETFHLQQIVDSCSRKDEKCCNHISHCQHKEHHLIKKTFYVTIILTDSFHSNMLLFIVLTKPICPYEKHGKNSYCLHAELSVHQCAIPCAIEQCFPTFLSWRDPYLCKWFTYWGEKK